MGISEAFWIFWMTCIAKIPFTTTTTTAAATSSTTTTTAATTISSATTTTTTKCHISFVTMLCAEAALNTASSFFPKNISSLWNFYTFHSFILSFFLPFDLSFLFSILVLIKYNFCLLSWIVMRPVHMHTSNNNSISIKLI